MMNAIFNGNCLFSCNSLSNDTFVCSNLNVLISVDDFDQVPTSMFCLTKISRQMRVGGGRGRSRASLSKEIFLERKTQKSPNFI